MHHRPQAELIGFAFYLSIDSRDIGHKLLRNLALKHEAQATYISVSNFHITLLSHGKTILTAPDPVHHASFTISSVHSLKHDDRQATLKITNQSCEVSVDHYGSVPIFFRTHKAIAVSNILSTLGTEDGKLSRHGLYAFLRLGHPVWNETVWHSIEQLTPTSILTLDANNQSVAVFERAAKPYQKDLTVGNTRSKRSQQLRDLNIELVRESLKNEEQIILPLSSGYDSRLILAALSDSPTLRDRAVAVTYGPPRSLEVIAAKCLAGRAGVRWHHVQIDSAFLTPSYLTEVAEIFGASLPMHAMYQIKFWEQVGKIPGMLLDDAVLTSGFMTGVPAGQHISKMTSGSIENLGGLEAFQQSHWWSQSELQMLGFDGSDEATLQATVSSITRRIGDDARASVWLDCWTRQRCFIAYYPRYYEWKLPVLSPHHSLSYIDFFQQIPISELQDRKLVEIMFKTYYSSLAAIPSDSNLLNGLGGHGRRTLWITRLLLSRMMRRLGTLSSWDAEQSFDRDALQNPKNEPLWGISTPDLQDLWPTGAAGEHIRNLVEGLSKPLVTGNLHNYYKLSSLQSICLEGYVRRKLSNKP